MHYRHPEGRSVQHCDDSTLHQKPWPYTSLIPILSHDCLDATDVIAKQAKRGLDSFSEAFSMSFFF